MIIKKKTFIVLILIGIMVLIGGAYSGYSTSEKIKSAASWPTVNGYVAESVIRWYSSASSVGGSLRKAVSRFYSLEVRTDYMIDGKYFSNTTPGINEIVDNKFFNDNPRENPPEEEMISLFKKVPQGTMVPVHYNPENKAESYIFSRLPFWNLYSLTVFFILTGVCILLIPLGMWIFYCSE